MEKLIKKIESEIEREITKRGAMESENVSIFITLTDDEVKIIDDVVDYFGLRLDDFEKSLNEFGQHELYVTCTVEEFYK